MPVSVNPGWMDPAKVRFATIHCAATPRGRPVSAADISAWDRAKFGQISYHHVIQLDGTDVQTLRYDQRGAHVGGHNSGNIGLCYVGGVERDGRTIADTRTTAQRAALAARCRALRARYPAIVFRGHRDWSPDRDGDGRISPGEWLKGCPSFDVAAWIAEIGL